MSQAATRLDLSLDDSPARSAIGAAARMRVGRVLAGEGGRWDVDFGDARVSASRAAGCLIEPRTNDRVLVALTETAGTDEGEQAWLLNVLDREEAGARLSTDGDLELVAARGKVRVQGTEGLELGSPAATKITTGRLEVVALSTRLLSRQLLALGERVKSEFSKVEVVAETVDTLTERLRQKAKRAFRHIEGLDQHRAGTIDTRAEGLHRCHAADQVVTADGLVKVDGKQIHIG